LKTVTVELCLNCLFCLFCIITHILHQFILYLYASLTLYSKLGLGRDLGTVKVWIQIRVRDRILLGFIRPVQASSTIALGSGLLVVLHGVCVCVCVGGGHSPPHLENNPSVITNHGLRFGFRLGFGLGIGSC